LIVDIASICLDFVSICDDKDLFRAFLVDAFYNLSVDVRHSSEFYNDPKLATVYSTQFIQAEVLAGLKSLAKPACWSDSAWRQF
jgi:hypothetical protein